MMKKISWIKANVGDAVVARLVEKLSKSDSIGTGDCGCGATPDAGHADARPKQA